MKKYFALLFATLIVLTQSTTAYAATMKFTIDVHIQQADGEDSNGTFVGPNETAPSMAQMKKQFLANCKNDFSDFTVGSVIRAKSGSNATVGLGKITGVTLGSIYKKPIDLYDGEETTTYDQYFAACIFTGSISNLRSSSFYSFQIGSARTDEYDSKTLAKKGWKLKLWISEISCGNYDKPWFGCKSY